MTATTGERKVKLTDAQRKALRQLYKAHVSGGAVDYKWATDATKMSLYKHGLIDGELIEKSWRGNERLKYNSEKINAAGIELGYKLFGMDWWHELVGAWVSDRKQKEREMQLLDNERAIEKALGLKTEFTLSGSAGNYTARHEEGNYSITVEKTAGMYEEDRVYKIAPRLGFSNRFDAETALRMAELLQEAARICQVFEKAVSHE